MKKYFKDAYNIVNDYIILIIISSVTYPYIMNNIKFHADKVDPLIMFVGIITLYCIEIILYGSCFEQIRYNKKGISRDVFQYSGKVILYFIISLIPVMLFNKMFTKYGFHLAAKLLKVLLMGSSSAVSENNYFIFRYVLDSLIKAMMWIITLYTLPTFLIKGVSLDIGIKHIFKNIKANFQLVGLVLVVAFLNLAVSLIGYKFMLYQSSKFILALIILSISSVIMGVIRVIIFNIATMILVNDSNFIASEQ